LAGSTPAAVYACRILRDEPNEDRVVDIPDRRDQEGDDAASAGEARRHIDQVKSEKPTELSQVGKAKRPREDSHRAGLLEAGGVSQAADHDRRAAAQTTP